MTDPRDETTEHRQAAKILGGDYDVLMDGIAETLDRIADDYDVALPDDAVALVQQYFAEHVVRSDAHDAPPPTVRLVEEMADPKSQSARANVSVAVGATHADHSALRDLANAMVAAKYDRANGGGDQ